MLIQKKESGKVKNTRNKPQWLRNGVLLWRDNSISKDPHTQFTFPPAFPWFSTWNHGPSDWLGKTFESSSTFLFPLFTSSSLSLSSVCSVPTIYSKKAYRKYTLKSCFPGASSADCKQPDSTYFWVWEPVVSVAMIQLCCWDTKVAIDSI